MIEWLFEAGYSDSMAVRVANALVTAAQDRPKLAAAVRDWILGFDNNIRDELRREYPGASGTDCKTVAAGIVGIYFNIDSLSPVGGIDDLRNASRMAAHTLVSTLSSDS